MMSSWSLPREKSETDIYKRNGLSQPALYMADIRKSYLPYTVRALLRQPCRFLSFIAHYLRLMRSSVFQAYLKPPPQNSATIRIRIHILPSNPIAARITKRSGHAKKSPRPKMNLVAPHANLNAAFRIPKNNIMKSTATKSSIILKSSFYIIIYQIIIIYSII